MDYVSLSDAWGVETFEDPPRVPKPKKEKGPKATQKVAQFRSQARNPQYATIEDLETAPPQNARYGDPYRQDIHYWSHIPRRSVERFASMDEANARMGTGAGMGTIDISERYYNDLKEMSIFAFMGVFIMFGMDLVSKMQKNRFM